MDVVLWLIQRALLEWCMKDNRIHDVNIFPDRIELTLKSGEVWFIRAGKE